MIKFYCDKCGKEITNNANTVVETTDITDAKGAIIRKIYSQISLICDECQYEELTCGFKVGDQVITDDGRSGVIESICDCDRCKKRGFYEPNVKMTIGNGQIWITDTDKESGFISFYQIGDRVFGNIDEGAAERIKERIAELRHELAEYESQFNMLKSLN
jgi:hypothetical protein